jgi:hypothetical protein
MARPLRLEFAGALYHVTARGNERRRVAIGFPSCFGSMSSRHCPKICRTFSKHFASRTSLPYP